MQATATGYMVSICPAGPVYQLSLFQADLVYTDSPVVRTGAHEARCMHQFGAGVYPHRSPRIPACLDTHAPRYSVSFF